jgi:serine/threonine-protein kinase
MSGGIGFYLTAPPEPPPTDPTGRIERFVRTYDGGDCFFVTPVTIGAREAILDGYGTSDSQFDGLDRDFQREIGFEATIGVHEVTQAQCAAVTFISRSRKHGSAPHLEIDESNLKANGTLAGFLSGAGTRHVELLLVEDNGGLRNLTDKLRLDGDWRSFEARLQRISGGPAQPQLIVAVVSARPLESLRPARFDSAEESLAHAEKEALEAGEPLDVEAKYFMLD